MTMPRSVAAMMSFMEMFCSPGISEMFGMRWNCTESHESANEQPCDLLTPVSLLIDRRLFARRLVVLEDSLLDDAPGIGGNTFVIPCATCE